MSGCITGYILGSIWGWIRGPSLKVASRGVAWGLDFGVLSALFAGTTSIKDFIMSLISISTTSSPEATEENGTNNKDTNKKLSNWHQKLSLWSVVIRNMILAVYFARNAGVARMIRSTLIYGGLTYYFVSSSMKRNPSQGMNMFGGGLGGGMNGMGATGQPSADAMQKMMLQLMAMQQQQQQQSQTSTAWSSSTSDPTSTSSNSPSTTTSNSSSSSSPTVSSEGSPLFNNDNSAGAKKANAMDVEFEPVDKDNEDELKP